MSLHDWWQQLGPRERGVLTAASIVLAALVLYLLIEPVLIERRRLEAAIPALQDDLAWMRDQADELRAATGTAASAPGATTRLTLSAVESLLRQLQLTNLATELEGGAGGQVRLGFETIPHAEFVRLLTGIRDRGLGRIASARLEARTDEPGRVEARIVLSAN